MKSAADKSGPAPQPSPARDRWLLSYADFLTLLLALFVVLYASARVDADKNRGLFEGLQSTFATGEPIVEGRDPALAGGILQGRDDDPRRVPEATGSLAPLERLEASLVKQLDRLRTRTKSDPGISVHPTERGLVITLAASEYFPAGGAEIAPDRKAVLGAIAPLLAAETGSLQFEGHTDDEPVKNAAFPSNWELSSARAAAVARYFIDEHDVDPHRVATAGHAAFRPIAGSDTPSERARNRRVEIVVLADGEVVEKKTSSAEAQQELTRLLEKLPAIESEVDESLRPPAPGPAPFDIPLP
jgi:chemotaxis protein MotB